MTSERTTRLALTVVLLLAAVTTSCQRHDAAQDHGHGHGNEHSAEAVAKGPHGGRLLTDGDFALEVTTFERGVPPEYRVYPFEAGKPLPPVEVHLTIALHRIGGRVDRIGFASRDDYLRGDKTVEEPHSFDVEVTAERGGKEHRWRYESYEGRTELSPAAIAGAGIEIATAGPATIRSHVVAHGRIVPNEDRLAHVIPRFPGVVKEVRRRLGDRVAAGETLAVVQSNDSLQTYEVKAAIAGTIIAKHVTAGEFAREGDVIYSVADLSTVWVDLNVPLDDFRKLRVSQAVTLESEGTEKTEGRIVYLSPLGAASTQMLLARVEAGNANAELNPGLFVTGAVLVEETVVPIAVEPAGLQTFRDWDVVFVNEGAVFQALPLELGRRDADAVEVVAGLSAGQRYAAENSFILKADVGKSGASHDH